MGMLKYWLAHHLGKPPFAAWASGVWSASAVCCQASVEKLPATRCGMKIKSVAGDCVYARSNTAAGAPGALKAHLGRFLQLVSLSMKEIGG